MNGSGSLLSIEPFPYPDLRSLNSIDLVAKPVQDVDIAWFTQLRGGDLLFIDSSHVVKAASDVNFLYLEVVPRLAPGVTVHIHDVSFPYDYQPDVLQTLYHWTEPSLVRALLTFNKKLEILFCMSHLHHERPEALQRIFPQYQPLLLKDGLLTGKRVFRGGSKHYPSSLYLMTK